MPVYTPPALNAVDFALTVQPAHSVAPAESTLSVYTVPALNAVDFALTAYTPPDYNTIDFELGATSTLLVIQNATLAVTAENLSLVQHQILTIQDVALAVTAENLVLTAYVPTFTLDVQDLLIGIEFENVTLTAYTPTTEEIQKHGSHRRNRDQEWYKIMEQAESEAERYEMKLSEELAQQLKEQIALNNAMQVVNANLIASNTGILNVVAKIQEQATVVPTKKEMEPEAKAALLQRLADGRKRKAEEEAARKKEMAKRMARVRKGKGK